MTKSWEGFEVVPVGAGWELWRGGREHFGTFSTRFAAWKAASQHVAMEKAA